MAHRFSVGFIVLLFCLLGALPAHAQDRPAAQKKALIKELLVLMDASHNSEAVASQMMEQMRAPLARLIAQELRQEKATRKLSLAEQNQLEAQANEIAARAAERFHAALSKRLDFGEIVQQVALEFYDRHFTEAEIKELIAFYRTPAAQKLIQLVPQMMTEMMPRMQELMMPAVMQTITEVVAEEKKKFKAKQD